LIAGGEQAATATSTPVRFASKRTATRHEFFAGVIGGRARGRRDRRAAGRQHAHGGMARRHPTGGASIVAKLTAAGALDQYSAGGGVAESAGLAVAAVKRLGRPDPVRQHGRAAGLWFDFLGPPRHATGVVLLVAQGARSRGALQGYRIVVSAPPGALAAGTRTGLVAGETIAGPEIHATSIHMLWRGRRCAPVGSAAAGLTMRSPFALLAR
jgi:hypothetical protein